MNPQPLAGKIVKALFCASLFAATLELSARVDAAWRWGAPFWGPYSMETLRVTDELGTRNRPNARFEKWVINSAGFRGPELSMTKPAGVIRVGIAGASEIFGLYESPEKHLTAQLQALLETAQPGRFEVVNLASAGMSPPRIRELFERWAHRFDFDVIVFYPTPVFYLDIDPPRRTQPPMASSETGDSRRLSLRLPDKVWKALRERLPARLKSSLKRAEIQRERSGHPPGWVWSSPPPERVTRFASDLEELIQTFRQAEVRVVLATHAHRFSAVLTEEDLAQMEGWIRFNPRATAECLLEMERQANEIVRRIGRERGVPVVDIQEVVGKDPRQYADFSHLTDEGATRAARALADQILTQSMEARLSQGSKIPAGH